MNDFLWFIAIMVVTLLVIALMAYRRGDRMVGRLPLRRPNPRLDPDAGDHH